LEIKKERKPATRVFQHFSFRRPGHAEPIRRSVGTRPRRETTRSRGRNRKNAIRGDSRLFAVGFLTLPHLSQLLTSQNLPILPSKNHPTSTRKPQLPLQKHLPPIKIDPFHPHKNHTPKEKYAQSCRISLQTHSSYIKYQPGRPTKTITPFRLRP